MAVTGSAAYAIYPQNVALNEVVKTLERGGFEKESICMMLSPAHPIASIVRDTNCGVFNVDANVVSAGLLGWLTGFGAVVIPTFGFFIRSRHFFRALITDQDSLAFCGRGGTLAGLGFSASDADRFEKQLRQTGVLIYVTCSEAARAHWALELLRRATSIEAGLLGFEPERVEGKVAEVAVEVSNGVTLVEVPAKQGWPWFPPPLYPKQERVPTPQPQSEIVRNREF